jgi:predicted ribosomally synthesized peptide with SipW-like signal peptide
LLLILRGFYNKKNHECWLWTEWWKYFGTVLDTAHLVRGVFVHTKNFCPVYGPHAGNVYKLNRYKIFMVGILNKKVLLAGSVVVAMAALALGATYAAWQASDSIEGNTVSTVELEITAAGAAGFGLDDSPIEWTGANPGDISSPVDRATITNDSSVALDLWMYRVPSGVCTATKVAWRSGVAGSGIFDYGYLGAAPTVVGDKDGTNAGDNFALVGAHTTGGTALMVADSTKFTPGAVIALQEMAGLADDADYPADAGTCTWTEVFVGALPGETPETVI